MTRECKQKTPDLVAAVRAAARQEQFLEVVSVAEARRRFHQHLDLAPLGPRRSRSPNPWAACSPPTWWRQSMCRRSIAPGVDGFAVRAADTAGASDRAPRRLRLNAEVIACGHPPVLQVETATATTIATGGAIPRGADAVVMVEQTELVETPQGPAIDVRRAVAPGGFVAYAGSDIARGETLLRRGLRSARARSACWRRAGSPRCDVVRRPKVAVLSTGDELVRLGEPLRPAGVYDSNGAIVAAAVSEAGGEPVAFGAFPDDETALELAVRSALAGCDMVVLSGGTSKGAGDLSHRIVAKLGSPGVLVHGVALKPGKPLCLAVAERKPIAVLPGFPTSAIFTFHTFVAPVIRALAGLPADAAETVERPGAGADSLRAGPAGIRAGRAGGGRARPGGVPDAKRAPAR